MDLYQPVGAGRRKKRGLGQDAITGKGKGAAEIYLVKKEGLVKRDDKRNFFPIKDGDNGGRRRRRQQQQQQQASTDFGDNVGVTVILPGEEYFSGVRSDKKNVEAQNPSLRLGSAPATASSVLSDCSTFLIVGAVLGSLLVVASIMMCVLSQRLYKISRRYNKEKLDDLVREHRRKFGRQPVEGTASGTGGLFRMAPAPAHNMGMGGGMGSRGS